MFMCKIHDNSSKTCLEYFLRSFLRAGNLTSSGVMMTSGDVWASTQLRSQNFRIISTFYNVVFLF